MLCCEEESWFWTFGSVSYAKWQLISVANVVKYYNSNSVPFCLYTLLLITDRMVVSNGAHRFLYNFALTFYNNKSSRDNS